MDPATAIQVASVAFSGASEAFKFGKAVYDLIKDAQRIDETAQDLASEVDALGSACNAVANTVQRSVQEHTRNQQQLQPDDLAQSTALFSCLERQITTCRDMACQLNAAISCIDPSQPHSSNLMNQVWRQIELNLKAKDIKEVRNKIKSHTSSLQLTLQCFNIDISYVIPNRVDQLLRERLDALLDTQTHLQSLFAQRSVVRDLAGEAPPPDDDAFILQNSERVKLSAESIYSNSQSAGSVMGDSLLVTGGYMDSWMKKAELKMAKNQKKAEAKKQEKAETKRMRQSEEEASVSATMTRESDPSRWIPCYSRVPFVFGSASALDWPPINTHCYVFVGWGSIYLFENFPDLEYFVVSSIKRGREYCNTLQTYCRKLQLEMHCVKFKKHEATSVKFESITLGALRIRALGDDLRDIVLCATLCRTIFLEMYMGDRKRQLRCFKTRTGREYKCLMNGNIPDPSWILGWRPISLEEMRQGSWCTIHVRG